MEDTKQVLDLTDEEIKAMLESGEIVVDDVEEEPQQEDDIITFDIDTIAAYEEISQPKIDEYDIGVVETSRYIGQFHSLINAGLNSESAIVIMSWIREKGLNDTTLKTQLEMAKIADLKMQQASL